MGIWEDIFGETAVTEPAGGLFDDVIITSSDSRWADLADLAPRSDTDFGGGADERAADLARQQADLGSAAGGGSGGGSVGGADERAADLARQQADLGSTGDGGASVDPGLFVLTPGGGVPHADAAVASVDPIDPPEPAPDPVPEPDPEPLGDVAGVRELDLSDADLAISTEEAGPYVG